MNVTTFTQFAQNCNIGSLVALYGSAMHVALSPGTVLSFAVLHTKKLAFQCAMLGIGSADKAMNLPVLCGDFQAIFFSVSVP